VESNSYPGSASGSTMPSAEEMSCFMVLPQMQQTCNSTLLEELFALSERALLNKLIEIDLSVICG
jgi:hypothetical protein